MIKFRQTDPGAWAVWHIEEPEHELAFLSFETCPAEIVHEAKRLEYLAARVLMKQVCETLGFAYEGLRKNQHGKPFLKENRHHVSLTHSYPYVAVQVHPQVPVGIDLEQPKTKLLRVAPRFLSAAELPEAGVDLTRLCVYWCAKEALYKLQGTPGVLFSIHLHIHPFQLGQAGLLLGNIRAQPPRVVELAYEAEKNYVVVSTQSVNQP